MGRFLQTDPIGSKDDLNLYAYVKNDPVNSTDPTGMLDCADTASCANSFQGAPPPTANQVVGAVTTAITVVQVLSVVTGPAAPVEIAGEQALKTLVKDAASQAVDAAKATASVAKAEGATARAAGSLVTKDGQTFTDLSNKGGAAFAKNDTVDAAVSQAKTTLGDKAPGFSGQCCEMNVTAQALNAGADVQGATAAAVRVDTGAVMTPCATCANVMEQLGINAVLP